MSDRNVRCWTGAFGMAAFVLILVAQPLYFIGGTAPLLEDTVTFSDFVTKHHTVILTRSLLDALVIACFLVFLSELRHLLRPARAAYEWAATLVFGTGLVWAILVLMSDVFEAAPALNTVGGKAEPVVVRALTEGSVVAFGAVGLIMAALFVAAARYAIVVATGAQPRWIGWVAGIAAILNLVAAPAIYEGTDTTGFNTADGMVSLLGLLFLLIWPLSVSIVMIVQREAVVPTPVLAGQVKGED